MMKNRLATWGFALLCNFIALTALAVSSPVALLESVSNQVLTQLKFEKVNLKNAPAQAFDIADKYLLPHADMLTMSRSVVGREAWNNATASQQQVFVQQFTQLLIRTYTAALAAYSNQTIKFFPIRGGWQNQTQVNVQSEILQPGQGPAIPVTYRMMLEGQFWKVVDMSVDNVSIVDNYRAQFANDLSQGGLAKLNDKLIQHNAQLAKQA